ncbi:MAG: hypothetical protein KF878_12810 [Planctomycetes bacterium]|nr:hypothetical protein [Planctomycetota bacterium]
MSAYRLSWPKAIRRYARRLGAKDAHRVAERVLILSLLAAHAGTPTPAKTGITAIDRYVRSLPRHMRRRAQRIVVDFINDLSKINRSAK